MRKFKKCLVLLFTFIILSNCMVFASAANVGVSEIPPEFSGSAIVPYGTAKPTDDWNLSTKGQYDFGGSSTGATLYSNFFLTGATKVEIHVTNSDKYKLTVKLLKSQVGVDWSQSKQYVMPNEYATWSVSDLDPSAKYILYFSGPSDFDGYIKAT